MFGVSRLGDLNLSFAHARAIEGENCVITLDRVAYTVWRLLKTTIVMNKWTVLFIGLVNPAKLNIILVIFSFPKSNHPLFLKGKK